VSHECHFLFEFAWKPQAKPATPLRISSREGKKKVGLCSKACFGIYQPQAARNKIVFAVKFVF
jgi:hypothetical protein